MASANVWAPLRWKHAKIHRGSRQRVLGPHQEAGYTSAVVTVAPDPISVLQSGGVHIRPHMALSPASDATRPGSSAQPCQGWGRGFESHRPLQNQQLLQELPRIWGAGALLFLVSEARRKHGDSDFAALGMSPRKQNKAGLRIAAKAGLESSNVTG